MKSNLLILVSLFVVSLSFAQPKAAVKLPYLLICKFAKLAKGERQEIQKLYTRLETITEFSSLPKEGRELWKGDDAPKAGEAAVAPWSGGYYGASISPTEYLYKVWSCDTENRFYSFQNTDLSLAAKNPKRTKVLRGKVDISERNWGTVRDLICQAVYK